MSNFIEVIWFIFKSAIILEVEGVEPLNLQVLLVFMCYMTSKNDNEF